MTLRNIATALICTLVPGSVELAITIYFANQDVGAQTPPAQPAPKPLAPKATPAPAPAQAAPSGPIRTETINYDNWTVTCRDTADGKSKKVCVATMPMRVQQQNQQVTLGVLIAKGVELKLGNGRSYKLSYVDCSPKLCESTLAMDEVVIREVVAGANDRVSVTLWKTDGTEASITLASIKGVDKAIAAVR